MGQETEQERPPNAGKCWLVLQQIKVHCVLATALVITLLLTAGWLACGEYMHILYFYMKIFLQIILFPLQIIYKLLVEL